MIKTKQSNLELKSTDVSRAREKIIAQQNHKFIGLLENKELWNNLHHFANDLTSKTSFKQIVVIGIGGSSQGLKSIVRMVAPEFLESNQLLVLDNTDEFYLNRQFLRIKDPDQCLWVIVSKSGRTAETAIIIQACLNRFSSGAKKLPGSSLLVSGAQESPLRIWAKENVNYQLDFTEGLDGRFSVLSPSCLIILKLLNIDIDQILSGAHSLTQNYVVIDDISNFLFQGIENNKNIACFWLYQDQFDEFGQWLAQLWSESLGKSASIPIPSPLICRGSNSQHSLLQQIEDGQQDKIHIFFTLKGKPENKFNEVFSKEFSYIKNKSLSQLMQKFALSTSDSLSKNNQASLVLELDAMDNSSAGMIHQLFHLVIATLGELNKIDIYGQPGVERSKELFRMP